MASWQPPQGDSIKSNTDAAIPQGEGIARFGVVLRKLTAK
ncbi:hypothetical protein SLEP1_g2765 [Rubroshorea leprosula]|uniref:Uncharacterized protein n=1 Tax=Rubroshorea leprosula TaxID=152421 RepID=A0AAV5HRX6_9ROSI|nr:hypothetical protein SLEP1_g2765 [Rubroshorea leprosula]